MAILDNLPNQTRFSICVQSILTLVYSQTKDYSDTRYNFWYLFTNGCRAL